MGELKKQIAEQGNIATVSRLDLNINSTMDLTELYEAKNLTELDLYYHHDDENDAVLIPDLSKLTKLKKLSINFPLITDVKSLSIPKTVTELEIRSESLDNTDFSNDVGELTSLSIFSSGIKEITGLDKHLMIKDLKTN